MMLITGPRGVSPDARLIADALGAPSARAPRARMGLAGLIEHLRTPGDPAFEALKVAAPWVSDLASYERWGYAVFVFIYWPVSRR